ncbi:MAG: beta-glucosidase BglX [Bacteroidales bacterium]|jgi:beta-glucosidase
MLKPFNLFYFLLSLILISCSPSLQTPSDIIDMKADSVLGLMTLEEKVGQLTLFTSDMDQTGAFIRKEYEQDIRDGRVGAIFNAYGADYTRYLQELAISHSRLKIPLLFGYDVIHGHRTIFPVPIAEASSWDLEAIERSARIAAIEATAEGLHWTFAPMADISIDPRWGRVVEGAGEDPWLASQITAARVRGFQGDDLTAVNTMAATIKHFAAYGDSQAGRDYHSVDMSERRLRETFLPPYKAAIDAGVKTVMTSFNDLNGIPATANHFLMTQILRDEWGFDGFVVTDYTAIMELLHHGVAADTAEAAKIALQAGVDMDMQSGFYQKALPDLVKKGLVSEQMINKAVKRILKIKFELGLFDDPFRYSNPQREKNEVMREEFIEAARDMARKSIVLLKNDGQLLPLSKEVKRIALIGPLADGRRELIGSWSAAGDWTKAVTLYEGLKAQLPHTKILVEKGCDINSSDRSSFAQAIKSALQADVIILALGESYWMSGEAASRSDIKLPGVQEELAKAIHSTGKPVITVIMSGRPLTLNWLANNTNALIQAWFLGTSSGNAITDVLTGNYNPSGKLPMTFPKSVGQIPIHYNMKNTGRPFDPDNKYTSKYLDISNEPLYAFGYGLSYTTFEYNDLKLSQNKMGANDTIQAYITITNTGAYAGEEVVQLYIHDPVASVTRAVKELKDFRKITLIPGESSTIYFDISRDKLSFYDADMRWGAEKGDFIVMIGGSSDNTLSASFELSESIWDQK